MTSGTRSYCVVGGGISGLTAAYRLRVAVGDEASITLFDPADRLGGVLRTERVGGIPMDVGAEAFVVRRPEMPSLLDELGLANRQVGTTGARPLIYSQDRLHPLPSATLNGIPSSAESMAGLVNDATLARIASEPSRPFRWQPGGDPAVADVVADRFGEQVVARSVDPMLGGVYAGSAATIGLRSATPTLAAVLDGGAANLTDAVRAALLSVTAGPVFGAVGGGYTVLVDELVRRSSPRDDAEVIHDLDRVEGSSAKADHDAFDAAVAHDEVRAESYRRERDRERQRAEETGEVILVRRPEQHLGRAADPKPCRLGDRGVGDEAPA